MAAPKPAIVVSPDLAYTLATVTILAPDTKLFAIA